VTALFNPAVWAPVILAWSFLLLLPFGRSSELPMFIMAILGAGQIYAHQLLLEVGSETGLIGLAGLLAFFVIFIHAGRNLSPSPMAWAAWLGAFAWLFPVNTHTAIYSAYWSLLIGWLIAVSSARHSTAADSR
jgi:hypothetical protein